MKFRKTLKVLAASALLLGTVGLATSCGGGEKDNNGTTDVKGLIINEDAKVIRADFNLVDKYLGCDLTWTSSNEAVAKITKGDGTYKVTVTRPDTTTEVTLTAKSGDYTKDFKITVPAVDASEIAGSYTFAYNKKTLASGSYDLETEATYAGKKATIAWSIAEEFASSAKIEGGKLVVTGTAEKAAVTIQAAFTYNNETSVKKYTITAFDNPETNAIVTQIEVGVPYILHMTQGNLGKELYCAGTMQGYYGATTTDKALAVHVKFEQATGGYHLTFNDSEGAKKYINIVESGTHINYAIGDAPTSVWTWNADYNTPVTVVGDKTYYIGTYKTHETISPSTIDKAATSFPMHLTPVTSIVTTPEVGVQYDFVMMRNEPVYFTGEMKGYYGKTSAKISDSLPISLVAVEGGYNITYTDSSNAKKYINAVVSGTYINFKLEDSATSVWTWDTTKNTLVTVVNDTTMYVGLDSSHDTIGVYKADKVAYPLQLKLHYSHLLVESENSPAAKLAAAASLFTASYNKAASVTLPEGVTAAVKSGTGAAVANGVVSITPAATAQTVVITLTAGTETKDITISIAAQQTATAGTFTANYVPVSEAVNKDFGVDLSSFFSELPAAIASIIVNQGTGVTGPRADGYAMRIYKGTEMVITAASGYKITELSFDFDSYNGVTYNGAEVTIAADGKSVTVTCPTEKHFRIKAIHVTVVAE